MRWCKIQTGWASGVRTSCVWASCKVYMSKLCKDKLYVDKLCGDNLCGDKLCVDKREEIGMSVTQNGDPCRQVPCLPRKVEVHVANFRTCHAKWRSMSPSATPATQTAAASTAPTGNQARHQSQPSALSATPTTQSDARWRQVPRLLRKQRRRPRRQLGTKRATRAIPVP